MRDVMQTDVRSVRTDGWVAAVYASLEAEAGRDRQRLFPALSLDGSLVGVLGWADVPDAVAHGDLNAASRWPCTTDVATAFPDETLRIAADRMVAHRVRALPVVERDRPDHLVGLVAEADPLRARERRLLEERHRERVLRLRR